MACWMGDDESDEDAEGPGALGSVVGMGEYEDGERMVAARVSTHMRRWMEEEQRQDGEVEYTEGPAPMHECTGQR